MPHDPIRAADTRAWLDKAHMDLKAAAHELTAVPPFTADAVFHAQQAAEKALKGFLVWHDAPFRKTHDLAEVGRRRHHAGATHSDARRRRRATP